MLINRLCLLAFLAFIISCTSASKDNSKESRALLYLQLGTQHLLKGNYPQALRELLEAEKLDPNEPTIQNNLGLAYLVREKFDEAETHFKKALKQKNDYTDARNNLGRLYVDVGLYKKAIAELETAAADLTYEAPEKSWANLGQAYFADNQYAKAKKASTVRSACHSLFWGLRAAGVQRGAHDETLDPFPISAPANFCPGARPSAPGQASNPPPQSS